jgi:serine/threonine protein kinase
MSATFRDPAMITGDRTPEKITPTTDLESTTDLHGDSTTTDLSPPTTDVASSAIVGTPSLERVDASEPVATPHHGVATQQIAPGTVLCDRYILERVVGTGGTAVVYQACDMTSSTGTALNTRVALKLPRPERGGRARATARLHHEYENARKLSHRSIVRVFDLYDDGELCFMTMELVEGRLLSTIIRDWTLSPRPLANKILRACAQALAHAHTHDVVHGDFKPGNVFVTRDEDVKIVDFGASATMSGGSSRIPAGTPAYASPQVLSGETPDRRDDVFSFACVAYELLTGQHPFQHRSSLEAREAGAVAARAWSLTPGQWLALTSALAWDREQRPADVTTLLDSLLTASEPIAEEPLILPAADSVAAELPSELIPAQRGWGFFMFVACVIAVILIASQRQAEQQEVAATAEQETAVAPASLPAMTHSVVGAVERPRETPLSMLQTENLTASITASTGTHDTSLARGGVPGAATQIPPKPLPAVPLSEISFESRSIVTTESSVAAVFLIKRAPPLRGRARLQWRATSGTAEAGSDFASGAAGSVEFADGQAQRAIYVPLRNDLLKEGDETFTVQLMSPQNARLAAGGASAEATIRDDD